VLDLLTRKLTTGLPSSSALDNVHQTLLSPPSPAEAADLAISTEALPWLCEKLSTANLPAKQMLPALLAVERLVAYGKEAAPLSQPRFFMADRSSQPSPCHDILPVQKHAHPSSSMRARPPSLWRLATA
jgi:hypothetical protein